MDKKSKAFLIFSAIFLSFMVIFFGYRFITSYRIEHPKEKPVTSSLLIDTLKKQAIVSTGSGIYKEENNNYYYGTVDNNYLYYNGIIWRILSYNDNSIDVVADTSIGALIWNYKSSKYEDSYIHEWLIGDSSIFASSIDTSYLVDTDSITLVSKEQYEKSGGKDGYLHSQQSWWIQDIDSSNHAWFVNKDGIIEDDTKNQEFLAYGIRPLIKLKGDSKMVSGNGTKASPYILEKRSENQLKNQSIGEYITYNNLTWRIVSKEKDNVKVVLDGVLKNDLGDITIPFSKKSNQFDILDTTNIAYYLNNDFYDTLKHKEYLVEGTWYLGEYNKSNLYDYKKVNQKSENSFVGLLHVADLFTVDQNDAFLITGYDEWQDTVYKVVEDGTYDTTSNSSPGKVRPAIIFRGDLFITGKGTKESPFEIGGIS